MLVLTLLVMLVSFGSPWLAVATVALNLLSVGAAYGMMTLVFQNTWAEPLLGFTGIGTIAAWIPLILFVILFGLSMDYHVFVVSRVREAFDRGADPREAVRLGVARSAGVVTSAAVVMVAVFAIFATLSSLEMKQLGRRPGDRDPAGRHAGRAGRCCPPCWPCSVAGRTPGRGGCRPCTTHARGWCWVRSRRRY